MKLLGSVIGLIALAALAVFLLTSAIQWLWGFLIPGLFPVPVEENWVVAKITFKQAFCLSLFTGLLFVRISSSKK